MTEILYDPHVALLPDLVIPLLQVYDLLPQLIREVLIDRAITEINLSPEESLQACQQFYQRYQLQNDADLETWMNNRGLSYPQLEHMMMRDAKREKFKHQTWDHQLESYFLQRKTALDRVIYSLIRVDRWDLAQELYFRIQEGETSFADVAQTYSQGAEAQTGGLIGPVELSVPHPTLAKLLSTSQPGQLSPPMPVAEWIVLVRLEQFLPAQLDEAMRQRLLNELFSQWLQTQMQTTGVCLMQHLLSQHPSASDAGDLIGILQ
jgi:parvulin-like peptidyl-prolyl isomerase